MNKDVFKEMPSIETERLLIRPFVQSDFYDYANWHNSGEMRYCFNGLYDVTSDNEQFFIKFFLHRVPKMFKSKLSGIWCISEKTTCKNIGLIEVCKYDAYVNTAQIHYAIAKDERCRGYATEAVNCMLNWAFNIVDLNRIYTFVSDQNTASSRVLTKSGFKLEGIMRQAGANTYTKNGEKIKETKSDSRYISEKEYQNICIYAILREEYNPIQ